MAVTIKDVAARCGLSISTVSKAFNNYADISAETREAVQRAAKEIGYYPNAIARTLKTNRSFNLGVLFYLVQMGRAITRCAHFGKKYTRILLPSFVFILFADIFFVIVSVFEGGLFRGWLAKKDYDVDAAVPSGATRTTW